MGKKEGNLSQDFDLFGGILNEDEKELPSGDWVEGDVLGGILDDVDKWAGDKAPATDDWTTEPKEEPKEETPKEEPKPEEIKPEWDEPNTKKDVDAILDEIMNATIDIDDKVDDVKDAAEKTWDSEMVKLVDELQNMLVEKNQDIEQLTKQNELISTRSMDNYANAENYGFYKGVIESLESKPKLMQLVKYIDSDNEKMQTRTIDILSDLIFEKTGEDISALINDKQKAWLDSALTDFSWGWEPWVPASKVEESELTREDSLNQLF